MLHYWENTLVSVVGWVQNYEFISICWGICQYNRKPLLCTQKQSILSPESTEFKPVLDNEKILAWGRERKQANAKDGHFEHLY